MARTTGNIIIVLLLLLFVAGCTSAIKKVTNIPFDPNSISSIDKIGVISNKPKLSFIQTGDLMSAIVLATESRSKEIRHMESLHYEEVAQKVFIDSVSKSKALAAVFVPVDKPIEGIDVFVELDPHWQAVEYLDSGYQLHRRYVFQVAGKMFRASTQNVLWQSDSMWQSGWDPFPQLAHVFEGMYTGLVRQLTSNLTSFSFKQRIVDEMKEASE